MSEPVYTVKNENFGHVMGAVFDKVNEGLKGGDVVVTLGRGKRSLDQNSKFHAMISDISKSVEVDGRKYAPDVWKVKLVDDFENELLIQGEKLTHPGEMLVSLDGRRIISKPPNTSKFIKMEGSKFIEYLYMKGAEYGAKFNEESIRYYEEATAYLNSKK